MILVRVSFRYEFIPVPTCSSIFVYMTPVRNFIGMRFDHILYRYHVKEVRGFVTVRDEWLS